MAATYKDIQRATGLSLSTISKYFNGGRLREESRRAIEEALAGMDYRVNTLAQGLKSRRSRTVGVLIPELTSTFHTTIMAEVEGILRLSGYGTIVCDCRLSREEEREALQFLLDKMVDGVITIPLGRDGAHLAPARQRGVPVVLIDRLLEGFEADAVVLDNAGAGALAALELARGGHRRAAILCGPRDIYTMRLRRAGFCEALARQGMAPPGELVHCGEMTVEGGYAGARRLLGLGRPPTAVFCANYEITLGAVIAMNEAGARIPQDISLIGFDNLLLSRLVRPRLSMVVQPMEEIAKRAAQLMLARLNPAGQPPAGPQVVRLPARLVAGESVSEL